MQRFQTEKKTFGRRNIYISILVFLLITVIYFFAVHAVSGRASSQEAETLKEALNHSIVHCYAVEGSYPESLDYIKENYGINYDEDRFFVDYQPRGQNIIPDITIIDKEIQKKGD